MTAYKRRKVLIERMHELESQGMSCHGCQGTCCTFEANSMMVTPLEVLELKHYLDGRRLLTPEFRQKCRDTVSTYRLDVTLGTGRRSVLRRTYTCPFFNHQELGCPLPREIKPYGCLAFNAHHEEMKAGEHCYSEISILEAREKADEREQLLNQNLKMKFKLNWDKLPLPVALLEVWQMEISDDDLR